VDRTGRVLQLACLLSALAAPVTTIAAEMECGTTTSEETTFSISTFWRYRPGVSGQLRWRDHEFFWDDQYTGGLSTDVRTTLNNFASTLTDSLGRNPYGIAVSDCNIVYDYCRRSSAPYNATKGLVFEPPPLPSGQVRDYVLLMKGVYATSAPPSRLLPSSPFPTRFALRQSVPNPFRRSTSIGFDLAQSGHLLLDVYDLNGRRVRTLISEQRTVGQYVVEWDRRDDGGELVSTGVYLYRISTEGFREHENS